MKIREVTRVTDLEAARPAWDALYESASSGELFQSYEWLHPWLQSYQADRRIAFLLGYEGAGLAGVLPLLRDAGGPGWCPGRLATPVNAHVRRQGLLCAGDPVAMLDATFSWAARQKKPSCVAFRQLPADGTLARELPTAARRAGMSVAVREETSSSSADLSGGWDAYVAGRSRHVVREMRRKTRKLERTGEWSFRVFTEPEAWQDAFEAVLEVEARSWKQGTGTSIANEPGARRFYGEVTRLNAELGRLCVHVLEHRGRPAAHVLGLLDGRTLLALKTAYDEDERAWAPGAVLMWRALKDAADRGLEMFDFLGDTASWKQSLATHECPYVSMVAFPPRGVQCHMCRTLHVRVRPAARRMGMTRIVKRMRGRAG